jgi:HK97 gp10 family phage protein
MAGFAIRGRITGVQEVLSRLDGVKRSLRNRILKGACRKAARPVAKAARAKLDENESVVTGALRRSIGVKVGVSKRGVAYAVIGPRRKTKRDKYGNVSLTAFGRAEKRRVEKGQATDDPAYYAHLVEYGHGGPHPAPPKPFLRPAYDETRSEVRRIFAEAIGAGLAKAAKGDRGAGGDAGDSGD